MKYILWVLGVVIMFAAGIVAFLMLGFPKVSEAQQMTVEITDERVERGKYLANHVTVCMDCHAQRDWTRYAGPPKPGTEGAGGDVFDHKIGLPGTFVARNITPYSLSDWTDGELYRLITTGVTKDNDPIFPIMPYLSYGSLDPEDVKSIIAYLRTIPAIEHHTATSKADFPVNLIMRTMPMEAQPMTTPDTSDVIAYGKYLATISACADCHTPFEKGQYNFEEKYGGGRSFPLPGGAVTSANISSDVKFGIGSWTKEQFVQRFKSNEQDYSKMEPMAVGAQNTVMPWSMYAGMTERDLESIFAYLQTVEPVSKKVEPFALAK